MSASQVRRLFEAALALPAAQRAEFLRTQVADEVVRERVSALLRADAEASAMLAAGNGDAGIAAAVHAAALPPRLGEFEPLAEIGRGGMGVVWRARQPSLGREVALKVLPPLFAAEPRRVERFLREARLLAGLHHPGIVPVLAAGTEHGFVWFAMELVDGVPLATLLQRAAALPPHRRDVATFCSPLGARCAAAGYVALVATWMAEAAEAIHHAHEHGVLHRDLKPSNLMVLRQGRVQVIDFGLAAALGGDGATITTSREVVGSPAYAAPEQLDAGGGGATVRSDVFSLGVVLYELLAGRRPYEVVPGAGGRPDLARIPPELRRLHPGLPRDLATVCQRAIEVEPARRYASAGALAADLRALLAFRPIAARPPHWARRLVWGLRRHRRLRLAALAAMGCLAAAIVLTVGSGWANWRQGQRLLQRAVDALAAQDEAAAEAAVLAVAASLPHDERLPALRRTLAEVRGRRLLVQVEALRTAIARAKAAWDDASARLAEVQFDSRREHVGRAREVEEVRLRQSRRTAEQDLSAQEAEVLRHAETAATVCAATDAEVARDLAAAMTDVSVSLWLHAEARRDSPAMGELARCIAQFGGERELGRTVRRESDVVCRSDVDAEVFVFTFRPRLEVRDTDVSLRQVPVPWCGGNGALAGPFAGDLRPGDPCLVVHGGEHELLRPGDLIASIDGEPVGAGYRVVAAQPGGAAAAAGVEPWARLVSLDGIEVVHWAEIRAAVSTNAPVRAVARQAGRAIAWTGPAASETFDVLAAEVDTEPGLLLRVAPPRDVPLGVVRGDRAFEVVLPAGQVPGIRTEPTWYPLLWVPAARVGSGAALRLALPVGDWLFAARCVDGTVVRAMVEVAVGQVAEVDLRSPGPAPAADVVWVPPGPVGSADDPQAPQVRWLPPRAEVPGFWIGRREVTTSEWDRFCDDPSVRPRIDAAFASDGQWVLVPRTADGSRALRATQGIAGRYAVKDVSRRDVDEYLAFLNRELTAAGEPFQARLPTALEWLRAAGSTRHRIYTWGDTWQASLCHSHWTWPRVRRLPVGTHLGDESPLGAFDLGGNVEEWVDVVLRQQFGLLRGGSSMHAAPEAYRLQSEDVAEPEVVRASAGFRVVYERTRGG